MYLTLIALPLLGAIIAGFRGRAIGATGAQLITTGCLLVTTMLALVAFYEVALCRSPVSLIVCDWVSTDLLQVRWAFIFDDLTVAMLLAVLIVSTLVHVYSTDYMAHDPHNQRFIALLSLFTAFMVVLVTSDNLFGLFVGWEGIGVASYLLISFWLTRLQANKAAIKAMTVNRVGDMSLSLGFLVLIASVGSVSYGTIASVAPLLNETIVTLIGLLLLGGAMSKSANVPLHTWLPDAMEGPTPVSALIHAATLVTAGVYLLLRSSPLLEYGPTALLVITWVGALTALFAATTGLVQNDLKRVIAYSTCSQMGYLIMAIGTSQYAISLFHLVNHAFFKALLFLSAGAVLHGMSDQQDMRRLGGLVSLMPFIYTAMTIGSLSLIALPFMTGYYSKDALLELAYGRFELTGSVAYWAGTLSAMLTAYYSYRLISLTFFTVPNASKSLYAHSHEASLAVIVPLTILSLLAIGFGYLAKDLFNGIGSDYLSTALFVLPNHIALIEAEFGVPLIARLLPAILTLVGAAAAITIYHAFPARSIAFSLSTTGRYLYAFLNAKWCFDGAITSLLIVPGMQFGLVASKVLDRGVIELAGPYGLSTVLTNASAAIASYDTGVITTYALYMSLSLLTLVLLAISPVIMPYEALSLSAGLVLVLIVSLLMMPRSKTAA